MMITKKPILHRTSSGLIGALYRPRISNSNYLFLMGYVEERLWWPIKSPNIGLGGVEQSWKALLKIWDLITKNSFISSLIGVTLDRFEHD